MIRSRRTLGSPAAEMVSTPDDVSAALAMSPPTLHGAASWYEWVRRLAEGNAVVVFSHSGCCMCHALMTLLLGLGVAPVVYELDQLQMSDPHAALDVQTVLGRLLQLQAVSGGRTHGDAEALPVVFVGGRLIGGLEAVMACHIAGALVPLLKEAGALWL